MEDLTGERFGRWTVLGRAQSNTRDVRWECVCDCGTRKSVLGKYLRNGKSKSCGCSTRGIKGDMRHSWQGYKTGKITVEEAIYGQADKKVTMLRCRCDCGNQKYISPKSIHKTMSCGCSRRKDLTGQTFGYLTVLQMVYGGKKTLCKCRCKCGNTITVSANSLQTGNTKSCGCLHSPSLVGKRFGRLTVVQEVEPKERSSQRRWRCLCDCGQETIVDTHTLNSGHTMSCGCLFSQATSKGETLLFEMLSRTGIEFVRQKSFQGCVGSTGYPLRFDFYIPSIRTAIQYDGAQHFQPVQYFGGQDKFARLTENDQRKSQFCERNNICLIRLPYTLSSKQIEQKISEVLNISGIPQRSQSCG